MRVLMICSTIIPFAIKLFIFPHITIRHGEFFMIRWLHTHEQKVIYALWGLPFIGMCFSVPSAIKDGLFKEHAALRIHEGAFMHTMHSGTVRSAFFLALAFLSLGSCTHMPDIIGKWQEIGTTATLEFQKDGTFSAVDDMEMAVSGKYKRHRDGRTRFEIIIPESPPDIVWGRISVRGEELLFTSDNNEEVERYRRAR
jgi:hypothetical protein